MDDEPALSAARIAARCEPQVNRLTRQIVAEQATAIPGLAVLPARLRDVEMAASVRHGFRLFLRFAQGGAAADRDLRVFRERAAQRMTEGVPLTTLLSAYLLAYRSMWRALCAVARPGEEYGLRLLGELMFQTLEWVTSAVSEAYLGQAALAERGEALRAVARALLAGQAADDVAARHGVTLEPGYHVLHLAISPDGASPVEVRRRLRTVQAELDRRAGEPVMTRFGPDGGHALLPLRLPPPDDRLPRRLAEAGVGVHVGLSAAARRADVPAAAGQATRIAEVARAAGRPEGLYELGGVLLDYHLSAPGASGARLAGLLDVLDSSLLETLEAYFAADFDRRATARALNVHPNTVDNRLARVSALIGADLRASHGILLVGAALTARRLGG
ncbi:helix-turn-helix domain-containing protein [Nonomuraea sp. SMC257]|uniref:Helix-turn-helix domain-containing protein n=1 Tax=Nonomuraea montanisoli TaxID=2741721 RepID=A0A7Y6IHM9_9ACTN|nr:helix-turn-helix domain-containing protein [Nonomuraea montanisoli]NUW38437.1 helix-turn-helix domain-containing protein [Nonomuraea montanisoli]